MNNVAIVAITKNGLNLGKKIHDKFTHWVLYAPDKFSDDDTHVTWFNIKPTFSPFTIYHACAY